MQRMNIKCCHCGDYIPFITEENIEVIPQVNLTRTDMDILAISPRNWRNAVAFLRMISYAGFRAK